MIHILCSVYIIAIYNLILPTNSELYRSISDVVQLLETQKDITYQLEIYVKQEEERLTTLKRYLDTFKKEHQISVANVTSYLGNPINAFRLIKRLTIDAKHINQIIGNGKEYIGNILKHLEALEYPSEDDLKGAAHALSRLRDKYKLEIKALANGQVNKDSSTVPLTSSDCFIMGRVLYSDLSYNPALSWFLIALEKLRAETYIDHALETDIIEYIATYNFTNKVG